MENYESLLCENCVEQIFHPICIDCLEKEVVKWLRINAPFMIPDFRDYSQDLKDLLLENTEDEQLESCIICGEKKHIVLCTYCYIRETYHYLRQFSPMVADEMTTTLNFDFQNTGYFKKMKVSLKGPSEEEMKRSYVGVCDECENFSHCLLEEGGEMLCDECRE
ncbi:MAG: hypothetical protein ACLFS3_01350 [Candidatus Aenigmatarchaeota archaeon]